jgi:hypothetical protein
MKKKDMILAMICANRHGSLSCRSYRYRCAYEVNMTANTRHPIPARNPRVDILLAIWIGLPPVIGLSAHAAPEPGNIDQPGD